MLCAKSDAAREMFEYRRRTVLVRTLVLDRAKARWVSITHRMASSRQPGMTDTTTSFSMPRAGAPAIFSSSLRFDVEVLLDVVVVVLVPELLQLV